MISSMEETKMIHHKDRWRNPRLFWLPSVEDSALDGNMPITNQHKPSPKHGRNELLPQNVAHRAPRYPASLFPILLWTAISVLLMFPSGAQSFQLRARFPAFSSHQRQQSASCCGLSRHLAASRSTNQQDTLLRNDTGVVSHIRGPPETAADRQQGRIRELVHNRPEHLGLGRIQKNSKQYSAEKSEEATLGDIMSSGLVTEPRLPLAQTYGFDNPLDRMVLTANGNLQRLISSYYDSAVSVDVEHCTPRSDQACFDQSNSGPSHHKNNNQNNLKARVWDRVVHLTVLNRTFCTATSVITVRDPLCVTLVESGRVGLGQLFRYLDLLPEFCLVRAEQHGGSGGFWREYTLECREVSCRIREDFVEGLWELNKGA